MPLEYKMLAWHKTDGKVIYAVTSTTFTAIFVWNGQIKPDRDFQIFCEAPKIKSPIKIHDWPEHGLILNLVDVESERPDRDAHHALAVVEELDGLGVQGEVIGVLKKRQSSMSKSANLA